MLKVTQISKMNPNAIISVPPLSLSLKKFVVIVGFSKLLI